MSSSDSDRNNNIATSNNNNCDEVEYFPRRKRAPYLHDISDFGIHSHRTPTTPLLRYHDDDFLLDDNNNMMSTSTGGTLTSSSSLSLIRSSPTKLEGGGSSGGGLRRKSSFIRVFSKMRMSITENDNDDDNGDVSNNNNNGNTVAREAMMSSSGPDDGGGGRQQQQHLFEESSESNLNSILPTRFRRGSSADFMVGSRGGGGRDRLLSSTNTMSGKIPRWALYDPATIVIKDGMPISMGTLLHHYSLLNNNNNQSHLSSSQAPYLITPTWRLKERMKTVGVCLILALNIGTDPPDLNKPTPCAKLQCWLDPTSISRAKAKERIGERLEQQYAKWQQRSKLKYRRALDPTVDTVRELCYRMRDTAKNERVLFHYNGHGVPKPTANGEIWLFDKHHTNYIPLSVTDLRRWIGKPSILVLDCSGAGVLMPFLTSTLNSVGDDGGQGGWNATPAAVGIGSTGGLPLYHNQTSSSMDNSEPSDPVSGAHYLRAIRDTIVLCPTAQGEWLPLNPEFPADIFTSCLTTPIPMALRWFVYQNPFSTKGLNPETITDAIPGKLADRKTPLGELNWIFTAITDTIAWNVLPSPLFQRLFRQDLLVASMFRNFLLANRILRCLNCTPSSHPELPSTHTHPLWLAWDHAVETCLNQLMNDGLLRKSSIVVPTEEATDGSNSSPPKSQNAVSSDSVPPAAATTPVTSNIMAPFFAEQLTAFEIWLEYASQKTRNKLVIKSPPSSVGDTPLPFLQNGGDANRASHELDPPQQLPIVLQVLLSQAHRVRALCLLKRFLDLGFSAVNLALSVGIFPYVLKLLQSPIDEYKHVLVGIWAKVLAFDLSTQVDVVKDRALPHFIRHLRCGLDPVDGQSHMSAEVASEQRTLAAFILSITCSGYSVGQTECINEKLHLACGALLQSLESPDDSERKEAEKNISGQFRMWLCICLGNLAKDNALVQSELWKAGIHFRLLSRLDDDIPEVRAASCYALACLIGSAVKPDSNSDVAPAPSMVQQQPNLPQSLATSSQPLPGSIPGVGGTTMLMANLQSQKQGLQQTGFQPQLGGSVSGGTGQSLMFGNMLSSSSSTQQIQRQETKTVYEDGKRMDLDLTLAIKLAETFKDASPMVRFEAALALNRLVGKYIAAFVSFAGKGFGGQPQGRSVLGDSSMPSIPFPNGVSHEAEKKFAHVWSQIFKLNRNDPHPAVRSMVNSIVIAVNERAMMQKTKLRQMRSGSRRRSMVSTEDSIAEDDNEPPSSLAGRRTATGLSLSSYNATSQGSFNRSSSLGNRTSSGNAFMIGTPPAAENPSSKMNTLFSLSFDQDDDYFFPESKFFTWKKVEFGEFGADGKTTELDPLSEMGAINKYRRSRNYQAQQRGQLLKNSFAVLAQKPAMSLRSPYDYDEGDAAAGIEKETDIKKQALQLQQLSLLKNSGARSTSLLRFHPYEPALVVCGSSDNVSIWNAETAERCTSFSNTNPKGTRMTAVQWVNEASSSLLLTGSNDGSVRIFDGLLEANDEISREKPSLVSSFFAAPDIVTDKRYSSGLILDYQQFGGKLTAGGNTKYIRSWDIDREKCVNTFESKSDACLTTLTTAWDYSFDSGYSGLGPDIIVCGYGNGSLRVFDTRSVRGDVMYLSGGISRSNFARRRKYSEFDEHTSWIVDVSFTTYGGRHEVVSGCVAGSIKFWDLRYSSSVRTIDHKMQMTALAAHHNVPFFATGSPNQFIKIMSHDGSTQQAIRFHDRLPGQRIGPVSCLCFHPQMPFLAAGFADENISLFGWRSASTNS